jgi:hypothetical protein
VDQQYTATIAFYISDPAQMEREVCTVCMVKSFLYGCCFPIIWMVFS